MNNVFNLIRKASENNEEVLFVNDPKSLRILALYNDDEIFFRGKDAGNYYRRIFRYSNPFCVDKILILLYQEDILISKSGSDKNIHTFQNLSLDSNIEFDKLNDYSGCFAALAKSSFVCQEGIINQYLENFKYHKYNYILWFIYPQLFTNPNFNGNFVPELEEEQLELIKDKPHLADHMSFKYESVQNYINLMNL